MPIIDFILFILGSANDQKRREYTLMHAFPELCQKENILIVYMKFF